MKLYIKQRVFSFNDKYDIYDMDQNVVYNVEGEMFTINAKMHLKDPFGRELYFIKKRFTFFMAQYEIYKDGSQCAAITQQFSILSRKLNVRSIYGRFEISGNCLGMDYDVLKDGQYFGSIHKKWLSWGDSYEIDIFNQQDAPFMCALVVAIDNCMHNQNNQ